MYRSEDGHKEYRPDTLCYSNRRGDQHVFSTWKICIPLSLDCFFVLTLRSHTYINRAITHSWSKIEELTGMWIVVGVTRHCRSEIYRQKVAHRWRRTWTPRGKSRALCFRCSSLPPPRTGPHAAYEEGKKYVKYTLTKNTSLRFSQATVHTPTYPTWIRVT